MDDTQTYVNELRQCLQEALTPPIPHGQQRRGNEDLFSFDNHHESLQTLLTLFDQSPFLQTLLGEIISHQVIASEHRLRDQLEQQSHASAKLQLEQEHRQRRENILLNFTSLLAGWSLSLLGTPANVAHQFFH